MTVFLLLLLLSFRCRWRLIDLVRQLATAAARDGSNSEIARKYTRAMRNTQADQMDAMKAAAQKVWEVQLEALQKNIEPASEASVIGGLAAGAGGHRGRQGQAC